MFHIIQFLKVVWIETWRSENDFEDHMAKDHIKKFIADSAKFTSDIDLQLFTVIDLIDLSCILKVK